MQELRIALVCCGGASGAVYTHGVAQELHRLVEASRALECGAEAPGSWPRTDTRRVYLDLLKRLGDGDPMRVAIDVVAAGSADAINAVALARALAYGLPLDALRDAWLEDADAAKLACGARWLPARLRLAGSLASLIRRRSRRTLLDGAFLRERLAAVLREMTVSGEMDAPPPGDHPIDLLVTIADLESRSTAPPLHAPGRSSGAQSPPGGGALHTVPLRLRYRPGVERCDLRDDAALLFAALAAASSPGVLPPVAIGDVHRTLGSAGPPGDRFEDRLFRHERLAGREPGDALFAGGDEAGGSLFELAVRAIGERPAARQVRRRLVYVDPDPEPPASGGRGRLRRAIPKAAGVRRRERTAEDVLAVHEHNRRVAEIEAVIDAARGAVASLLDEHLDGLSPDATERIESWRRMVNQRAAELTGLGHCAYARLKITSAVAQLAGIVNELFDHPEESDPAAFVREAVGAWACDRGLLCGSDERLSVRQVPFLRAFDLDYRRRRLRFLIRRLDACYDKAPDPPGSLPPRGEIDWVKASLSRSEQRLAQLAAGDLPPQSAGLEECLEPAFGAAAMRRALAAAPSDPARHAGQHAHRLDRAEKHLVAILTTEVPAVHRSALEVFERMRSLGWSCDLRRDLLVRYLGFPLWDTLVYPLQRLAGIEHLTRVPVVRLGPQERALTPRSDAGHGDTAPCDSDVLLERAARERAYLFGRLHTAERLVDLLADAATPPGAPLRLDAPERRRFQLQALRAATAAEKPGLRSIPGVLADLERSLGGDD